MSNERLRGGSLPLGYNGFAIFAYPFYGGRERHCKAGQKLTR